MKKPNPAKDLYKELRKNSCEELWAEVGRFNEGDQNERADRVALLRAVGVVFSESGSVEEKAQARAWLLGLLNDPVEKIRRYAMAALPKLSSGPNEEAALVALLRTSELEREKSFLGKALNKIGGEAALEALGGNLLQQNEQKIRANIARAKSPSVIQLDPALADFAGLRIHLRGRKGLEKLVAEEVEESISRTGKFKILKVSSGLVALEPLKAFSLSDIYSLRCFGTLGMVLGVVDGVNQEELIETIAAVIASKVSLGILETFTQGSLRYRLELMGKGIAKGAVRAIADRAYALCPTILNDAQSAPWAMEVRPVGTGFAIELRPRLTPDPRLAYRKMDIPAASHPPLAACMVRLAGRKDGEIVWDPFCGSGLELVERAIFGGVRALYGTDRSEDAISIALSNFSAAGLGEIQTEFSCCDFRDFEGVKGLGPNTVTLLITNPPLGKRIPIPNLRGMIEDLFRVASTVLRPGGRLVFANPFRMESPCADLKLKYREIVDFGGFNCRLEKYVKTAR